MARKKSVTKQKNDTIGYPYPVFSEINPENEEYDKKLHWAVNYANAAFDTNRFKKETQKLFKKRKLSGLEAWRFITVGKYAWIVNNGGTLSERSKEFLERSIAELEDTKSDNVSEEKETVKETANPQARAREKLGEYLAEVEEAIDTFVTQGYKSDFSLYEWLKTNEIAPLQAKRIAEAYEPLCEELKNVPNDKELKEGYSHLKKTQLNAFIKFVESIISDGNAFANNQKKQRKQRKKKSKSAAQLVNKVKYLKESEEYKIASVSPESIIGAKQLWTFNVKYRQLTRIDAATADGLSIKGTTVQNIDQNTSEAKRLRKPQEYLTRVLQGGKIVLRKVMDEIKTKPTSVTGRLNDDTILLRVVK